jgi:hypothetical protein
MKIFDFFENIWGKLSEPEPKFLTSWSRSQNFRQAGAGAAQKWTASATLQEKATI